MLRTCAIELEDSASNWEEKKDQNARTVFLDVQNEKDLFGLIEPH
jgi:hypothetical protein